MREKYLKSTGELFEVCGALGVPVIPTAVFHYKRRNLMIVKFGKPEIYRRNRADPNSAQNTADKAAQAYASLLPEEMTKGFFMNWKMLFELQSQY